MARRSDGYRLLFLILLGVSGCRFPKESVLSAYESVVQFAGQFALTPAIQLQGVRSFGEDHLEGNYTAHYVAVAQNTYSAIHLPISAL